MSLSNRHNNDNRIVIQIIPFRFSKVTAFLVPKNALLAKERDSFSRETSLSFQDGGVESIPGRGQTPRSDDDKLRFLDNGSESKSRRNQNTWDRKTKSMYDATA